MRFYRSEFNEVVFTLKSNEQLGLLNTSYIQDFYGNDGFVSIQNKSTKIIYQIEVKEVTAATPNTPNDAFRGVAPLSLFPNGNYRILCRLKDLLGNYSIIGEVSSPFGNETIYNIEFDILEGMENIVRFGQLTIETTFNIKMGSVNIIPKIKSSYFPSKSLSIQKSVALKIAMKQTDTIIKMSNSTK